MKKIPEKFFTEIAVPDAVTPETISPSDKPVIIYKRIGSTRYKVAVYFSKTSKETMSDKVTRIIHREIE